MTVKNILIIQPGLIGDCILTLPLARSLNERYRPDSITMWAHRQYACFLGGRSDIDHVDDLSEINANAIFDTSKGCLNTGKEELAARMAEFDLIVAFVHKRGSSAEKTIMSYAPPGSERLAFCLVFMPDRDTISHITSYHFKQFNEQHALLDPMKCPPLESQFVFPRKADVAEAFDGLRSLGLGLGPNLVALHPGAGVAWKKWHIDNFRLLARCLSEQGCQVLWIHGPAETAGITEDGVKALLSAAPGICGWPLGRLCGLFSQIRLYIGNDSGITHLAAACGCETVSIFGPTNEVLYRPIGPRVATFRTSPESFKRGSDKSVWMLMNILLKLKR